MRVVGAEATLARESLEEALWDGADVAPSCCLEVDTEKRSLCMAGVANCIMF